jgi:hypothetical protein
MKHGDSSAARIAHLIERTARWEGKTGEGKVSTEAIASILELPGEPIFSETGVGGVGTRISAISLQSDLPLLKTPDRLISVEFPTPARACMRVKRRTRAAVENSFTAVQHLTRPLFLSKPVEPPINTYDALNRLLSVLDPANGTTVYSYDAGAPSPASPIRATTLRSTPMTAWAIRPSR